MKELSKKTQDLTQDEINLICLILKLELYRLEQWLRYASSRYVSGMGAEYLLQLLVEIEIKIENIKLIRGKICEKNSKS